MINLLIQLFQGLTNVTVNIFIVNDRRITSFVLHTKTTVTVTTKRSPLRIKLRILSHREPNYPSIPTAVSITIRMTVMVTIITTNMIFYHLRSGAGLNTVPHSPIRSSVFFGMATYITIFSFSRGVEFAPLLLMIDNRPGQINNCKVRVELSVASTP